MDNKPLSNDNKNQIKKCVSDLYKACEEGNHNEIVELVNEQLYSYSKLEIALRKLLLKFDTENEAALESLQMLLKVYNINYQNPNDKTTIIMEICSKGDVRLIQFVLQSTFDDKLIEDIINYSLMDNANCNFIHYIFYRNTNEQDAIDILMYFFDKYKDKQEYICLFASLLEAKDKGGNVPISILLSKGWYQMLKLYLSYVPFKSTIVDGNNNLLHCAIAGKNIGCLKVILFNSKIEELKHKNKDGLTPIQFANKRSCFFLVKIMEHYEKNYSNIRYRKHFLNDYHTNMTSINYIDLFQKEEYEDLAYILALYQLNQNINSERQSYSIMWNIMLIEYKLGLKKRSIIKKADNSNANVNNANTNSLSLLLNFFETNIGDNVIEKHNEDNNGPIDILVYNKGLLYFFKGDLELAIKAYSLYLNFILKQNDTAYYKWIIYVNISFILIEIFYSNNQITICHTIIETIEEFLISSYRLRNETHYDNNIIDKIYEYFNESELFHRFTPGWDESFCYLILLKIKTNYSSKSNQIITEYKKRIESCSYVNELKVFQRMKLIYALIKIKISYFRNTTKCLKKLNAFTSQSFKEEDLFLYYNSLGILNLKLKQYTNAEYLLKLGIMYFKKSINNANTHNSSDNNKSSNYNCIDDRTKHEYIFKMRFNLALALFYLRKFKKAREILIQLLRIKFIYRNIFVWYRLGLCSLEIELDNRNDSNTSCSGICKDILVYDNEKLKKDKEKEQDCISIDLNEDAENSKANEEDKDDIDQLYYEFEMKYGSLYKEDSDGDNGSINDRPQSYYKYILHSKDCKKKPQSAYVIEAINAFKQVLLLSKASLINNSKEVNDIIQFYSNKHNKANQTNASTNTNGNTNTTHNRTNPYIEKSTHQSILISSYYNLLFALSLKEEWLEILFFVKEFLTNKNFHSSLSNDIRLKIVHYQIEALINLHREKEALDIIQSHLDNNQNANYRFDYYSQRPHMFYSDFSFKLHFYISIVIIHIKSKAMKEAESCIRNIFKTFIKDKHNLPPYMINLLIYYYISQGRSKIPYVLMLLKNRKLNHLNFSSIINN